MRQTFQDCTPITRAVSELSPVPWRNRPAWQRLVALALLLFGSSQTDGQTASQAQGQTALPANVQADILEKKIVTAVKAKDSAAALSDIDAYKKLGVTVPPPILLVEAKLSYRTADYDRAFKALEAYLKVAQRGSKGYKDAVELFPKYKIAAQPGTDAKASSSAQHAGAPRPKPEQGGPSLAVTMKFIQEKISSNGTLSFSEYSRCDGCAEYSHTIQWSYDVTHVSASASTCLVSYHWVGRATYNYPRRNSRNGDEIDRDIESDRENKAKIGLAGDDSISIAVKQLVSATVSSWGSDNATPPAFVLNIRTSDGSTRRLAFITQEMANRVATALLHAAELCNGNEPF